MRGHMQRLAPAILALCCGLRPAPAAAHSFGRVYNLPVPVWMYLYGAAAALALSFVMIGYFVTERAAGAAPRSRDLSGSAVDRAIHRWRVMPLLKLTSVAGLALCLATGFLGTPNPYGNFNMTFFWVVFVLGLTYLTALVGDVYAAVNPWRVIAVAIGRIWTGFAHGRLRYPPALGYWPALAFYLVFIWIELFGKTGPFSLAVILSAYTGVNLLGVWLVGARAWFRYCEFFSVFFRLVATLAPLEYVPAQQAADGRRRLRLRPPFSGLLQDRPEHISLLVFVLFMLASTAFDGLHETAPWRRLFWVDLYHAALADRVGHNPLVAFPAMNRLYHLWQSLWLIAAPFIYLVVYLAFVTLAKLAARSELSLRDMALRFALPLLPIALVYNITHYYTLIQIQGVKITSLASDPFGRDWNLFGTGDWFQYAIIPNPITVWHVQVVLIVLGHIVSVYIAHLVALRSFPTRRQATLSQLPMLMLMVLFTTVGLWILAQPIAGG